MIKHGMIVLLLLVCSLLSAQEFPVRAGFGMNFEGHSVRVADGSQIVFWTDTIDGHRDIYAQKISPAGVSVWDSPVNLVSNPDDQVLMDVILASDNNLILLWGQSTPYGIMDLGLQKVSSNGQRLWGQNGIMLNLSQPYVWEAKLVPNNQDGAFVAYYAYAIEGTIMGHNLDGSGNQLWNAGGIPLYTSSDFIQLLDAVSDNSGGLMINILRHNTGNCWVQRTNADGTPWSVSSLIPPTLLSSGSLRIIPDGMGQFIVHNYQDSSTQIRFNRINNQGTPQFAQPKTLNLQDNSTVSRCQIKATPGAGVAVAMEIGQDSPSYQVELYRLDNLLEPMGMEPIHIAGTAFTGNDLSLDVASDGRMLLTWRIYNTASPFDQIKGQLVNPDGNIAWDLGGKTVSTTDGKPLSIATNNGALVFWQTQGDGYNKMMHQSISNSGNSLYGNQGYVNHQTLNGMTINLETLALGDNFVSLWWDWRDNTKLYYQVYDNVLQPLLAVNGVSLNPDIPHDEALITVAKTPRNTMAILYTITDGVTTHYLQELTATGAKLYPGAGVPILNTNGYFAGAVMGFDLQSVYLGWTNDSIEMYTQLMAQKITNGQVMWGAGGKAFYTTPQNTRAYLQSIGGSYFVWREENYISNSVQCKTLLLNANGDTTPGWNDEGVPLLIPNQGYNSSADRSMVVGNDLIVFLHVYSVGQSQVRAQRVNHYGDLLWTSEGVLLPGANYLSDVVLSYGYIACLGVQQGSPNTSIRYYRLALDGTMLVNAPIFSSAQVINDVRLASFVDSSYLCTWSLSLDNFIENRDLYMLPFNPGGHQLSDAPLILCSARNQQNRISLAASGNRAFITWQDDRAGIVNSEYALTGIWGREYVSTYTSVDDPVLPAGQYRLQNYPNPFNPSTTISFTLSAGDSGTLGIYNLKGQLVRQWHQLSAGDHRVIWDGRDAKGNAVSSGMYLYRLDAAKGSQIRRMMLIK